MPYRRYRVCGDVRAIALTVSWATAVMTLNQSGKVCATGASSLCSRCATQSTAAARSMAMGRGTELCLAEPVSPTARPLRETSRHPRSIPGPGLHSHLLEISVWLGSHSFLHKSQNSFASSNAVHLLDPNSSGVLDCSRSARHGHCVVRLRRCCMVRPCVLPPPHAACKRNSTRSCEDRHCSDTREDRRSSLNGQILVTTISRDASSAPWSSQHVRAREGAGSPRW
jgi:hypothetical protein